MGSVNRTGVWGCGACQRYIYVEAKKCPHCGSTKIKELTEGELK